MSDQGNSNNDDYGDEDDFQDDGSDVEILTDEEEEGGIGGAEPSKKMGKKVPDEDRITSRFMTKYERARILGTRAL